MKRFFQKFFSLIFFLAILLNNFQPFFYLSFFKKTFAGNNLKVDISFNHQSNKFKIEINNGDANVFGKLNYLLAYQTDKQTEAVQGTEVELNKKENFSKEIYAGTCSKDICTPHKVLRGILKTEINNVNWLRSQLFEIKGGNLVLGEERDIKSLELTEEESSWLENGDIKQEGQNINNEKICLNEEKITNSTIFDWNVNQLTNQAETKEKVKLGVRYIFPLEEKVTVTFKCLPSDESLRTSLKIQKIKISDLNIPDNVNPYGEWAYDITTEMKDGSFEYDLTLPKPQGKEGKILYMEDKNDQLKELEKGKVIQEGNLIKAENIDHLTIFTVATYEDSALTISKSDFKLGETVYAKGTRSNEETYCMRLKFFNPDGQVKKECSSTMNGLETSCSYSLSSNDKPGEWSVKLYNVPISWSPFKACDLTQPEIFKKQVNFNVNLNWPNQWLTPNNCVSDPSGDESPSQMDIFGDSNNPAVFYATDSGYLYLRERVFGNPSGPPGMFSQHHWVVLSEQTGDNYYDYQFSLNGQNELVQIWKNNPQSEVINWNPVFGDPAETLVWYGSTSLYSRIDPDGTGHYFVSWAVPLNYGSFSLGNSPTFWYATATDANNHNKDHLNCYESPQTGSIKITKNVVPNDNSVWDFNISGSGGNYSINDLGDGQSQTIENIPPGSYNITEISNTNYTTTVQCGGVGPLNQNGFLGTVVAGQTLECTFTNTLKKGKLKIIKNALGGDSTFNFEIKNSQNVTVATPSATTSGGVGDTGFIDLTPDTYKIRELPSSDLSWYLSEDNSPPYCLDNNQSPVGSYNDKSHQITLPLNNNDEIICYFQNIKLGKLIIDKVTNPSNDPQTFDFDFYRGGYHIKTIEDLTDQSNPYQQNIFPDVWEIVEKEVNGWKLTSITCNDPDQGSSIDLTNNKAIVDIDPGETVSCTFTNSKYGSILVHKFNDRDGDGVKDSDDWALWNWQMKLFSGFDCQGDPIDQGVTNTSGNKLFSNLPAGQYSVLEVITPWEDGRDWVNTTGGVCQNVTLNAGQQANVVFGNYLEGFIKICKVNDLNGNGIYEGEPFISGWTMYLQTPTGQILSGITGNDGCYTFWDLSPGNYYLSEEERTGWIRTNPTDPRFYPILFTIASGGGFVSKIYNFQLGKISGYKFEDLDGDGVKDNNEPGLSGWIIELDKDVNGSGDMTATTGGDGYYEFTDLTAGTYRIREQEQEGWQQTTANPSDITIQSGTVVENVNFGNFKLGIIQGKKFNDLNIDGNHDNGEPYLNNWTIRLYKKNENNWDFIDSKLTGHTGTAGQYRFENLTLGQYKICEVLQTGWEQTSPTGNPNNVAGDEAPRCRITSINQSGQSRAGQSFGNVELGSISGTKYEDLNGDGNRGYEQGSEPGLENWTIELYSTSEGKIKSFITDSKGDYWFDNLLPGDYKVCEVLKNGWVNTQPGNGSLCYDINLKPGEDLKKINFGNFKVGKVTVIKFHDRNQNGIKNDGEEVLGGWEVNLASNSGILSKTTATDSGQVIFDNLLWGDYLLSEEQQVNWELTNIYCDNYQGNYDNNSYTLTIESGANLSCYIGNYHQPTATLSKSNNTYPNSITPGSVVTFTLKLKVEGNNLNNVVIKDILPPNFTFNNVWSAEINGTSITLPNPNYASPGTWQLGDLKEGDEVVINYQAKANSDIESGLYKDLAWAVGNETESETSDKILAKAVDSGNSYDSGVVSENFVGTKVNVNKDTQNYTNIDIKKEETKEEEGEVLGVATGLPATGGKAIWLILASFLVILGGVLIGKGFKKKIFKIFNLILVTGLYLLLINNVFAGSLSVRLSEPQSPTRFNNFKLNFVALELNNNSITVKCFYKKEGGVYAQFDTDKNLTAGGNIGSCQVTSSQINEEGKTYSFYVTATNGIETVNSEIVSVDYKTSVPGTPTNYSKEKSSACEYKIKFKTADDGGLTKKVEIYRSRETSFPLDGSTRVAIIPIGSNTDYTYTNSLSSGYCDDTWYYAVRAFDDAGNGSGWVGDAIITVVTKTTASSTVATVETPTPTAGAIEVTGITLPPAKTTETPEVLGEKTATSEISPTRVEEKKKIKSIGEILGETVKKENKNKLILIVLGILLLGIIGYVYKKKRE